MRGLARLGSQTWMVSIRMNADSVCSTERVIQVLPDALVDQIAAGEVIDRPSSVVKELVENAIDAGATHISVDVENGGKRLIRVLDNGCGMTAAQAQLALHRHATSKLRSFDDLYSLVTMGFRGEALPSIASVSRMTLTTRTRDEDVGTRLIIEAGNVLKTAEVGAPVGTLIEVADLLYNVPARLKFLKGNATESSHITDVINKLALAHPRIHFRLRHNSRTTVSAPLHGSAFERARSLLGPRLGRRLHPVVNTESGIRVEAFLAAPELSQTTSRGVQMFVGRRPVRDRGLLHAINMGYGELVPRGRYPVAVLFVDIPDGSVDVNVHPQKMEVRFSDAQAVYAAVRHTVSRGVGQAPWLADGASQVSPVRMHAFASSAPPARPRVSPMAAQYAAERNRMMLPWHSRARSGGVAYNKVAFPVAAPAAGSAPIRTQSQVEGDTLAGDEARAARSAKRARSAAEGAEATPIASEQATVPVNVFFEELRYIGQLDRTYLICEANTNRANNEMVLIDQHAAHERVEFQRLRSRYQDSKVSVQRLLFPRKLEVTAEQAAAAKDSADELVALGFELAVDEDDVETSETSETSDAGDASETSETSSVTIAAVPASLRQGSSQNDAATVLRAILDELVEHGGSRALEERLDLMFATMACHSVVRAGDALSPREAQALLSSLDDVDFRAHCPHGRPVLLRISIAEIARRFGRT